MADKCLICGSENIAETDIRYMPWACQECGAWGMSSDRIENPPPDDDWNPTGQIERKPGSDDV